MKRSKQKIGILTGGGDCPGLNAVIRAVVKKIILDFNGELTGFLDGYRGLVTNNTIDLTYDSVSNILNLGGTILGSSNRDNPFNFYYDDKQESAIDASQKAIDNYKQHNLDALICIGGDGTLTIAHDLAKRGINIVGIPKTIDNDVQGTDQTFGFDTAFSTAAFAIDKIRTTAESHHRAMVIELMGRTAGWLTLFAGIASGSDIILLPEIPYSVEKVCNHVLKRSLKGKRYSIIAIAEGTKPIDGEQVTIAKSNKRTGVVRLGGIGEQLARDIEDKTDIVSRTTVLGHLQRGGTPTPFDRILATRYGAKAAQLVMDNIFDVTVCLNNNTIEYFPLEKVANNPRLVPIDSEYIKIAKSVGSYFGD